VISLEMKIFVLYLGSNVVLLTNTHFSTNEKQVLGSMKGVVGKYGEKKRIFNKSKKSFLDS